MMALSRRKMRWKEELKERRGIDVPWVLELR